MIIFLIVLLALAVTAAALAFKAYMNVKNDYYILDNSYEIIRDYAEDLENKVRELSEGVEDCYIQLNIDLDDGLLESDDSIDPQFESGYKEGIRNGMSALYSEFRRKGLLTKYDEVMTNKEEENGQD